MVWGMVGWLTQDGRSVGGKLSEKGEYDELLASMNTESSDTLGDYYELLLSMNTAPAEESGE